ncbi:MAG: FkbM family methyltransferase [Gammaproteobacteria bacterium]|nr:FkbM family methyltransferase [Gammaproteobacteria bacterium]
MNAALEQHTQKVKEYESGLPYLKVLYENKAFYFATPNEKCNFFALSIANREPKTNEWIKSFEPGEIFFDIGANNGIYGLLAAILRDCTVYAFEPHFGSYYVMCLNIFANKLENRMFAYPLAITDKEDYGSLYLSATWAGKSLNNYGESRPHEDPLWNATIPQAAVSTSIDAFVSRVGVFPNHIKVDVDGLEHAIVEGASETLSNKALRSIMLELDLKDQKHIDVIPKMQAFGFNRYEEDEAGVFFYRDQAEESE